MEAGNDDDFSFIQQRMDLLGGDVLDFGFGMNAIGENPGLCPCQRNGFHPEVVQGHRRQRDSGLFAGGEEHVHLPLGGHSHDFGGELNQAICHTTHGGDDDDDLVALSAVFRHAPGDIFDALGIADRTAAVFLDD